MLTGGIESFFFPTTNFSLTGGIESFFPTTNFSLTGGIEGFFLTRSFWSDHCVVQC